MSTQVDPTLPFLDLPSVCNKPVVARFDGGRLSSDGGVLLLGEIERRLGLADRLARSLEDPRAPDRIVHGVAEMIRFRTLTIAAGTPDANDCDTLRTDPAFKMAAGRLPESGGAQAHDGGDDHAVLRQLQGDTAPSGARYRRHRGSSLR